MKLLLVIEIEKNNLLKTIDKKNYRPRVSGSSKNLFFLN